MACRLSRDCTSGRFGTKLPIAWRAPPRRNFAMKRHKLPPVLSSRTGSIREARMGATHFLMKTLPRVASEMALHVLAYNLTRVMNIIGVQPLLATIRA